jgi:hypothetical protein
VLEQPLIITKHAVTKNAKEVLVMPVVTTICHSAVAGHALLLFSVQQAFAEPVFSCSPSLQKRVLPLYPDAGGKAVRLQSVQTVKGLIPRALASQAGGAFINPRRKPKDKGTVYPTTPVMLTREHVDGLQDRSLTQAAAAVGVSPTAFKRACRRLGVARWAYCRRQAASKGDHRPPSGLPNGTCSPRDCEDRFAGCLPPSPPQHRSDSNAAASSECESESEGCGKVAGALEGMPASVSDSQRWDIGGEGVTGLWAWGWDRETADDELVMEMLRWG